MAAQVGVRIVRGPNWDGGDEDGGEGHVGTVIELLSNHKVRVLWDTGEESTCRAGADGKFDLRVFDTAQIGIRHSDTKCAECGEQDVLGMLWRCKDCSGFDLCTLCYYDDVHDLRHLFVRIDEPGCKGETVKMRKISIRIQALGTFPGAKIARGRDWDWKDQDGGPGSEGEVKGYISAPDSSRNLVHVQWSHGGPCNTYRMGFQGYVDLTCVEEEAGPFYYRDHLPVLDVSSSERNSPGMSPFSRVDLSSETQDGTASDGHSFDFPASGAESRTFVDETTLLGAKTATEKIAENAENREASAVKCKLSVDVGDSVAIKVMAEDLMELQKNCGGCPSDLLNEIGSTGKVTDVSGPGTVSVSFRSTSYALNPEALIKVHELTGGATVRIRSDEDEVRILNSRVGWKPEISATIGKVGRVLRIDSDGDLLVGFGRRFYMFAPACCLPAPDEKTESLTIRASTEQKSEPSPSSPQPSDQKEDVQDLYRKLREAILTDTVTDRSDNPDLRELLSAISTGDQVAVRSICQANRSLVDAERKGLTPLMLAVKNGNRLVVDVLLEFGADVNHCVLPAKTPLGAALEGKSEEMVELMLERGANPCFLDPRGHNYLHNAAFFNLPGSIRALAKYDVDVNHKDDFEDTPLHMAIDQLTNKAVEALVSLDNLDCSIKNKRGHPPLHHACLRGNARAVELIVARDKSQLTVFTHGSAPLHIAAQNDHDECVRILVLNGGADINLQDWAGSLYTPLHLACIRGKFSAAEALVELGADIQIKDKNDDTPLHLAIGGRVERDLESEAGQQECHMRVAIACMLISRGAYVDAENKKGRNPLNYGVRPVRDAIGQFVKHNKELVKKKDADPSDKFEKAEFLGLCSHQDKGNENLRKALEGVGLPCGVCGNPKSDVTLQPCQHKCVCSKCKDKVTKCPLCEDHVTEKIVTGPDEQSVDLNACKQM